MAARKRGIVLQFLAQNFTRHQCNTTRYNYKTNIIHWRLEWIFPSVESEPLKFVDEKCPENVKLGYLLDKYLNPDAPPFEGTKALMYYKAAGFNGVKVLLRAEKVKGSAKKFFELDTSETLAENLSGKCIVEFPIIFVVMKDHAYNFEVITPEDEFEYEKNEKSQTSEENPKLEKKNPDFNIPNDNVNQIEKERRKRPRQLLTEKIAKEKQLEIEKEIKQARKNKPKNLLFTTGYSSDESIGDDDSDKDEK